MSDAEQISPLELDILLPEQRLAIEYGGLFWHSELAGKHRWYHRHKLDACGNLDVRLLTIFEDEWLNTRSIAESMIRNALRLNDRTINARACSVRQINSDGTTFLKENHIQGGGRSNVKFGLIHDGELISVMSFSNGEISRRNPGWEVNRFCSKLGYSIRGGASKLFTAFLREFSPEKVTSYADLRWGTGAVYGHLGFEFVGNTVPNYWYIRANEMKRHHRYALRKQPHEPKDRTEWDIRKEEGWNRIWDCGHAKWVWSAEKTT